jgi:hypothetical protein
MDDKIISINKNGEKIYSKNNTYKMLCNVMEHPEFRKFYNLYMNDWEKLKVIYIFMKLYEIVEVKFKIVNPYEKIVLVKKIVENPKMREFICQNRKQIK